MTDAAPDAAPPPNGSDAPTGPGIRVLAQFIRDLSFENPRARRRSWDGSLGLLVAERLRAGAVPHSARAAG